MLDAAVHWRDVGTALVLSAAVCGALGYLWKAILVKIWRAVRWVDRSAPALADLAHKFERNGGGSFIDSLDRIEELGKEVLDTAKVRRDLAEANAVRLGQIEDLLLERAKLDSWTQEEIKQLHSYTHEFKHSLANDIQKLLLRMDLGETDRKMIRREMARLREQVEAQ